MDLYPEPLSIVKKLSHCTIQPSFHRDSSTESSARGSCNDTTRFPSHSPPLPPGSYNLDIPKVRRRQNQYSEIKENGRIQTEGKFSQFIHELDRKLSRHLIRGFSRSLSNIRPIVYPPLKYNFVPPISVLRMEIHLDKQINNYRGAETSLHIIVRADVNMDSAQYTQYNSDIDALILLNMACESDIVRVVSMTQIIINNLTPRDFITVACVNLERDDLFEVLYSSSENGTWDLKCLVSEWVSKGKHLLNGACRDGDRLGDAVERASRLFVPRERSNPHTFLVSSSHVTVLSTTCDNRAVVGLTTVTPQDRYELGPTPRFGWHISPDIDSDHRIEKALRTIRSRFTTGTITNLNISVAASGCDIQVCGKTSIASLRPGETWKVLVRARMSDMKHCDELERDIRWLLRRSDIPTETDHRQPVLVATLTFNHSLQPKCSSKIVESCRLPRE